MICLCGFFWGGFKGCWEDLSFFWFFQPHLHEVQYCPFPVFVFVFVCSFVLLFFPFSSILVFVCSFLFLLYFISFFFFVFLLFIGVSLFVFLLFFFFFLLFSSFCFYFCLLGFNIFLWCFVLLFLVRLGAGSFFSSVLFSEPQLQANL